MIKNYMRNKGRRREVVYANMREANNGKVPCFVCGRHVSVEDATLEHILPVSKGGNLAYSNLSISHRHCNVRRGNAT